MNQIMGFKEKSGRLQSHYDSHQSGGEHACMHQHFTLIRPVVDISLRTLHVTWCRRNGGKKQPKNIKNIKKNDHLLCLSERDNHKNSMVLRLILKMVLFPHRKGVSLQLYQSKDKSNLQHDKTPLC